MVHSTLLLDITSILKFITDSIFDDNNLKTFLNVTKMIAGFFFLLYVGYTVLNTVYNDQKFNILSIFKPLFFLALFEVGYWPAIKSVDKFFNAIPSLLDSKKIVNGAISNIFLNNSSSLQGATVDFSSIDVTDDPSYNRTINKLYKDKCEYYARFWTLFNQNISYAVLGKTEGFSSSDWLPYAKGDATLCLSVLKGVESYRDAINGIPTNVFGSGFAKIDLYHSYMPGFRQYMNDKLDDIITKLQPYALHGGDVLDFISNYSGSNAMYFKNKEAQGYTANLDIGDAFNASGLGIFNPIKLVYVIIAFLSWVAQPIAYGIRALYLFILKFLGFFAFGLSIFYMTSDSWKKFVVSYIEVSLWIIIFLIADIVGQIPKYQLLIQLDPAYNGDITDFSMLALQICQFALYFSAPSVISKIVGSATAQGTFSAAQRMVTSAASAAGSAAMGAAGVTSGAAGQVSSVFSKFIGSKISGSSGSSPSGPPKGQSK